MTDDDYFAQRAAGFRHLAKTYRSAGQVREAASCEAAARRDDAAAGRKYAVALRETERGLLAPPSGADPHPVAGGELAQGGPAGG